MVLLMKEKLCIHDFLFPSCKFMCVIPTRWVHRHQETAGSLAVPSPFPLRTQGAAIVARLDRVQSPALAHTSGADLQVGRGWTSMPSATTCACGNRRCTPCN